MSASTNSTELESKAHPSMTFVGFGEAGAAIAQGFLEEIPDLVISAYDIKTDSTDTTIRDAKLRDYEQHNVRGALSLRDAIADAQVIISTVTADQAFVAAEAVAAHISPDALFLDLNSCAPQTKQKSSATITGTGARYADVAVMAPIHPRKHKTPMLIAGPDAEEVLALLESLGTKAQISGDKIGAAAAIKMIRSIFVKGMEALVIEGVLAGEKLGVTQQVLDTLEASYPGFNWTERSGYMLERAMTHGIRRAAELEEVVVMLDGIDVGSDMSRSTAARQLEVGKLGIDASTIDKQNYANLAAAILNSPDWRGTDK